MKKFYGSLNNRLMEEVKNPEPEVGMGVTESMYSDRHAWYVAEITKKNAKGEVTEIRLVRATYKCNDYFAGNWTVFPFEKADVEQTIRIKRTRPDKFGRRFWTYGGKMEGTKFILGHADEYEDPSF